MTRAEWFAALAALAYPADRSRAENAMAPYAPWLSDMPDAAFTRSSLEAVINAPRKMAIPSYDEIRRPLAAWWRDNRPAEQRLASEYAPLPEPEKRGEPSDADREAVAAAMSMFRKESERRQAARLEIEKARPASTLKDVSFSGNWLAEARLAAGIPHVMNETQHAAE